MEDNQKELCHQIAAHYGLMHQSLKAVEEMSELSVELVKYANAEKGDLDRILEELADVCIMTEQLRFLVGPNIDGIISRKIKRQLKRIEEEKDKWVI